MTHARLATPKSSQVADTPCYDMRVSTVHLTAINVLAPRCHSEDYTIRAPSFHIVHLVRLEH